MLLTVNLGNTSVSYGIFDGNELVRHGSVPASELPLLTDEIGEERFGRIAVASVTPSRTDQAISLLAMRYSTQVLLAGRDMPFGIEIQCEEPDKVGVDRLLNAIAAYARTRAATVVAYIGTAITVDLVSGRGSFCGGAIAPGPDTMLRALHERTELLPDVAYRKPVSPVGRSTVDAMLAGVHWGTAGMVERLIEALFAEQTGDVRTIVTGGHAERVASEMRLPVEVVPALALEGLAILAGGVSA